MSAKSCRPSRSSRKNPKAAEKVTEPDWSEMTMDQREQELLRYIESLSQQPPTKRKPIDPEDIKRAARRGARKARKFLTENPAQDDIQAALDIHECEMHMLDDSPVDFAYHAAYLKSLRRQTKMQSLAEEGNRRPILTVMPDFGSGPFLWFNRDGDKYPGIGGNCCCSVLRCRNHPMSNSLFDAFSKWIAEFETASWNADSLVDPDDPESGYLMEPQVALDWTDFHARGLELAKWLKDEVGTAFCVVYEKPAEDPAHHNDERREVLDDSSVVSLPPRRPIGFI